MVNIIEFVLKFFIVKIEYLSLVKLLSEIVRIMVAELKMNLFLNIFFLKEFKKDLVFESFHFFIKNKFIVFISREYF